MAAVLQKNPLFLNEPVYTKELDARAEHVLKNYAVGRLLPAAAFNNYFGSTVFSKQVLKAVTGTVIQRSEMSYGSGRYRVREEFL